MFNKNNRLTDEDIDRIAEAVVNKIILKQKEIDEAYFGSPGQIDQEQLSYEMLLQNLVGLQILLSEYVKKELYEEAEIVKNKIAEIKTILDKFK